MTFGVSTRNLARFVNLDEELRAYAYIGKWNVHDYGQSYASAYNYSVFVDVHCVGFPLCFVSLPPADNNGITIVGILALGGSTWRVQLAGDACRDGSCDLRVFGRLDLNYPSGSGVTWGMQVYNSQAKLVFDSGERMLRLAAYLGGAGITIPQDTTSYRDFAMPIDLAGKSINAAACGRVLYTTSADNGGFDGTPQFTIDYHTYTPTFSRTGSTLRVWLGEIDHMQITAGGGAGEGYTFLGGAQSLPINLIDNAQYP